MDQLINQLNQIATIVMYVLLAVCVIGGGSYFYYVNVMKKKRVSEDMTDYSSFTRENTVDWIKFDDIKDNMIITDNGTRFVAVIRCQSTTDFYSAQEAEQASVAQGFYSFIGTIDKPITYRQYCKAIDMDDTADMYKDALEQREQELYEAVENYNQLLEVVKTNPNLSENDIHTYEKAIEEAEKNIEALKLRKFHIEDQLRYIEAISGTKVEPQMVQTWIVDWVFDPMNFSVDLNDEEIYERAILELTSLTRAKIHALSNCNVKAYRCTTEELIEMCRRYSCPESADRFKLRDIVKSSFFDDICTSDSVNEMVMEADELSRDMFADNLTQTIIDDIADGSIARNIRKADKNDSKPTAASINEKKDEKAEKPKKKPLLKRKVPQDNSQLTV